MIKIQNVTKKFGNQTAVNDLSFEIKEGELFVLLGESGSGKSTLMRMINGLIPYDEGSITINDREVKHSNLKELRRQIGYVVQDVGLFPNMNVCQNISIVPNLLKWDKEKTLNRVKEMLQLVRLEPSEYINKYPSELSGGEAQRVGVARALAADQEIILMDEPFGALDPITRSEIQDEFLTIQKKLNKTVVFVTHDMAEAMKLADRMAILSYGNLMALDKPENIIMDENPFVREFIGSDSLVTILSKYKVKNHLIDWNETEKLPIINGNYDLKEALNTMIMKQSNQLLVEDQNNIIIGKITADKIINLFAGSNYDES